MSMRAWCVSIAFLGTGYLCYSLSQTPVYIRTDAIEIAWQSPLVDEVREATEEHGDFDIYLLRKREFGEAYVDPILKHLISAYRRDLLFSIALILFLIFTVGRSRSLKKQEKTRVLADGGHSS